MFGYLFIFLKVAFTFVGGFFTLNNKKRLNILMALAAGMLVGVSILDLIPESLHLGTDINQNYITLSIVIGFLIFYILEHSMVVHSCGEDDCDADVHNHLGSFGVLGLSIHGFLDGMAIGLGFEINQTVGFLMAIPIIAHSLVDGLNTVVILLKDKRTRAECINWLAVQSITPIFGFFASAYITLTKTSLALVLAFFAGLFLYIGGSDLLPEAHKEKSTRGAMFATIIGFIIIFILVELLPSH